MRMKDTTQKLSIWVLYSDAQHGGYLFYGNTNQNIPPYHLGGIEQMMYGEKLVWTYTRKTLEMDGGVLWWNERFSDKRVKPKCVMVEIRPFYKRAEKKGDEK